MPRYEYACQACDLTFEAVRSFADADVPAHCPMCDNPARKMISMPMATFTRGAASAQPSPAPASSAARWSHHGHSHGPGASSHSH